MSTSGLNSAPASMGISHTQESGANPHDTYCWQRYVLILWGGLANSKVPLLLPHRGRVREVDSCYGDR
jgi:hypothetical protein